MFTKLLNIVIRFMLSGYLEKIQNGEKVPVMIELLCSMSIPFYVITGFLDLLLGGIKFAFDYVVCLPQLFLYMRKLKLINKKSFIQKLFICVLAVTYSTNASSGEEGKVFMDNVVNNSLTEKGIEDELQKELKQLNSYTLTLFK